MATPVSRSAAMRRLRGMRRTTQSRGAPARRARDGGSGAGRTQDCLDHAEIGLAQAISYRLGPHAAIASWALAALDLGAARPEEAFDRPDALARAAPARAIRW